jgi:hypothetical protein
MTQLLPDIIARVTLYKKSVGGFRGSISPREIRLNFVFEDKFYDCSILLNQVGVILNLGETALVPIRFLAPWLIKQQIVPGSHFRIWRGGYIGKGEVTRVVTPNEQIGSTVNIQLIKEVFKGNVLTAGEDEYHHIIAVIHMENPISYNGLTYEYVVTQSIRTDYLIKENTKLMFYRGKYCIKFSKISEEEATSILLNSYHLSGDRTYLHGNILLGNEELSNISKMIGLTVRIEVLEIESAGIIVQEGKDQNNRLRAIVRLNNMISYNGKNFQYMVARDNQMNYWPESFTYREYSCDLVLLSESEALSGSILQSELTDKSILKGIICLSEA